jgi:hypothetical protein
MAICRGGIAELVRNDLFPTCEEISALAAEFGLLPGSANLQHDELGGAREGEVPRSCTPIPVGNGNGIARDRVRVKAPLDMENGWYEGLMREGRRQETVDHISRNVALTHSLSEQAAQLPANVRRRKTRMRSLTDSGTVHLYSSQKLNVSVLAKARMRAELASDHTHQLYTYCQDYQSMTFEPADPESEKRAQKLADREKWRTREGFVYPGVPRARESNSHPRRPHSARMEVLHQPFTDGLLHTNKMKPTVDRLHFSWGHRERDFQRHYQLPLEFGPRPPISILLPGQRRAAEERESNRLATADWEGKVVVTDTCFYTHRRGVGTELRANSGPQIGKFEDILKDPPQKYSLRKEGLRLKPIPALDVVWNGDGGRGSGRRDGGGFHPGPDGQQSLRRDRNVVPLSHQRTPGQGEGWRERHGRAFRLFYHTHSPVSKCPILPLSPSEMPSPPFPPSRHTPTTT